MPDTIFSLKGKTAIVTGASRGLGQAIAIALAGSGANVCLTARDAGSLTDTRDRIAAMGGKVHAAAQDVRETDAIAQTVARFARECGTIDILINNAGYESVKPSAAVDEQLWDQIVDTNLKGAFFWSQAVARQMAEQRTPGSIVNLCSLTSYVGVPTAVPYTSSKSGLLGMTRALAAEWAPLGIRVNAIAPGYFRTAMTEVFYQDEDWQARMLSRIPQKRFGQEGDIGGVAVFLCSDAASYITGHCIPVDGGFLASI